ncbi:MAG TPA: transcriptional repressor [Pyrinomonadaceae bacterium]|nr:transcriptional repressor [Pyrinomonadaceae bacterium]
MSSGRLDQGGGGRALTRQREAVLQVIRENENHLTASEIYEAARKHLPSISYATVYNSLKYLREAGLVNEISFGGAGASRYDRETARHDHALCTACGKLVDFDLTFTSDVVRAVVRKTRFKPESIHLTLRGLCPDCRE